jgi:hypothetical protein
VNLVWLRLFAVPLANVPATVKRSSKMLKLFGKDDQPSISDIGQGFLGNCFLLSTMGAFA